MIVDYTKHVEIRSLADLAAVYRDDEETHARIHFILTAALLRTPVLRDLRFRVEADQLGFGDRAFYWLWKLVVDALPTTFSFLEIGVYKGQIISLIGLLASSTRKQAKIYGVTPLDATGDKYSEYPAADYRLEIENLQRSLGISPENFAVLIEGNSVDQTVKAMASAAAPFDCIYIDGGHDYATVSSDLLTYGPMIEPGGYLVVDDSSVGLALPKELFAGHPDVARACRAYLWNDPRYEHTVSVGHLGVWRRTMALT